MATEKKETLKFDAQADKILQLMIHSLYANKEIFIRELISNSSDACDKLRYESITKPELIGNDSDLKIKLIINKKKNQIEIIDNGIGMSRKEMIDNLGTIARSGTQKFAEKLSDNKENIAQLIGQFGVGFYSSFIVAKNVTVYSTKAGSKTCNKWSSKGNGEYTIDSSEKVIDRGTKIVLDLKDDQDDFLDKFNISRVIKTYSDHISIPVELQDLEDKDVTPEIVNEGSAIWAKSKSNLTKEQYKEFYNNIGHTVDEPWVTLHNNVEGIIEYTNLIFIPSSKPFDLFHPDRKTRLKLYVKRVFITDENIDLVPSYLRFVRGIVDTQDLPLNISRETLQHNAMIHKIRTSLVKKILNELKKKSNDEDYINFWENFGSVLKEGLCEQTTDSQKELLLDVCKFKTISSNGKYISLSEYIDNMQEGQESIYYITSDKYETALDSPHLEGFKKKNIDVIILTDPVDSFWVNTVNSYKEKDLKSITRSSDEIDEIISDKKELSDQEKKEAEKLVDIFKEKLGSKVQDVIISKRLTDSPVCLTTASGAMDMRMEKYLIEQNQLAHSAPRILEINSSNKIINYIEKNSNDDSIGELIEILYDQALTIEGQTPEDPTSYAKRLNKFIEKALIG